MATNVVKTYLGAVKPVGEKIVLNYVKGAAIGAVDDDFDFVIDANYYVTGLQLVKTAADLQNAANVLGATLIRVPSTGGVGDAVVAQAQLANTTAGFQGQTAIAGVPISTAAVGASTIVVPVSAAAPGVDGATLSSWLDPTVVLQANTTASGTTNSRQRLRLKIKSVVTGANFNPSCVVVVELAKYAAGITQGSTGTNGNQLSETLIPNLP